MQKLLAAAFRVLSSYALSVGILVMLLLLTLFGTLEQVDAGLHEVQKRYFESWVLVHHIGPVAIPLLGGQLLMGLLFVNLVAGGLVRVVRAMRKRGKVLPLLGVLVAHVGIGFLLIAGFVKFRYADDGHLTLYEGEREAVFESYIDWELAITHDLGDGRFQEHVIDGRALADMRSDEVRRFGGGDLPFDLELSHWMPNCMPRPKGPMFEVSVPVVDGFYLASAERRRESEQDRAGVYVALVERPSGTRHEGILWGGWNGSESTAAWMPLVEEVGGTNYAVELRHRRYLLPFAIQLDDFRAEFHPRTTIASSFESDVTKIQDGTEQPVRIQMNEPLRHGDYVLFQSGYGPPDAAPGDAMYSTFSVVRNPSDQWPLWSCIVIAVGLLLHFALKLLKFIDSETRRAAA